MKVLAIIPAKTDSKRLPRKNLQKIGKKTLVEHSIDYAKTCEYVTSIIVSTESDEVTKIAKKNNVSVHKRPANLQGETEVVDVYLDIMKNKHEFYDFVVGLQPDHPDRQHSLKYCLDYMVENNYDDLVTIEPSYKRSGSVRIFKHEHLINNFVSKRLGTICDNATDIHYQEDLEKARVKIEGDCNKKQHPKIIAEIGWNHMGNMELAEHMIQASAENGADYAKFQTWSVKRLKPGEWDNDGRKEIYKKAELSKEQHEHLIGLCNKYKINFLSSVFSIEDAKLLAYLNVKDVKIPSFESRNYELLEYCNEHFKNIFMSTGTSSLDEIETSAKKIKKEKLTLLHCVSAYPCEPKNANLPKIKSIKELRLSKDVGYSDHIFGVESAKAALHYEPNVIEKHFTTDRSLPGRDNKFAILPEELKDLKNFIKLYSDINIFHGNGYLPEEKSSREQYRGRFNG
jgi:sialic acid synthase SpsE